MKEQQFAYYRLLAIAFIASTSLLTSCFGPKNLLTQQSGMPRYDYVGDTLNGWTLVRQDSLWGYISADGKQVIKPTFTWATDFADGMALAQDDHGYRYINAQGKLLRRIKAPHAYSFSKGLAPVEIKGKWGYIDRKGKTIIKPRFDWAEPFRENRAVVAIGLKKGYINTQGEIVIPAIYEEAHAFRNGVAIVRKDLKYGMIDTLGNFILPNKYRQIALWQDEFYSLSQYSQANNRIVYGLADLKGRVLLAPRFSFIETIDHEYFRVHNDGLFGLYNLKGQVVIPPQFPYLWAAPQKGNILVQKDHVYGLFNHRGRLILPFEAGTEIGLSEDRVWTYSDQTYTLMDNDLSVIKTMTAYRKMYGFSNGLAIVTKKDTATGVELSGYIDRMGVEVIPPQFHHAGAFNDVGFAAVRIKAANMDKQYIINQHGEILSEIPDDALLSNFGKKLVYTNDGAFYSPQTGKPISNAPYTEIETPYLHTHIGAPFLNYAERTDVAKVSLHGKLGVIDTALNQKLPPVFNKIGIFYRGRLSLNREGKYGFADEQFRIRIPFIYEEAFNFTSNLAQVKKGHRYGAINRNGREVIPMSYEQLSFDGVGNRIYAKKADGIAIYDTEGRLLLSTDFESIGFFGNKNYVAYRKNGMLGFMDYDFQVLYEPTFDGAGDFYDGLAWVRKDEKGGYINEQFQLVIPVQFDDFQPFIAGFAKVKKGGREYYIDTKGEEFTPTEAQFEEREQEMKRRGWNR